MTDSRRLSGVERQRLGEALYALRAPALVLARRVLGDEARAEEACAESYLRALRHLEDLPALRDLRSWFLRVVVNTARSMGGADAARRRREESFMRGKTLSSEKRPEEKAVDRELCAAASEELQLLAERQRLAISLHYEGGLSLAEVAAALDVPEGTAASDISRGLERLRGGLAARGFRVAPAAVGSALAAAAVREVPAALSGTIKGIIAAKLGLEAATVGTTAAAGAALLWKLVAGVAAVVIGGLGVWGGATLLAARTEAMHSGGQAPVAKKPSAKSDNSLEKRVSLKTRGGPAMVLAALYEQTGLRWAIPSRQLIGSAWERFAFEDGPARKALDRVAAKWGLTWKRDASGAVLFNRESPDLAARLEALKAGGKDEVDRAEAVYWVGVLGDLRALPHLATAVGDESLLVRSWAAQMLLRHLVVERQRDARPVGRYGGRLLDLEHYWLSAQQRRALVSALLRGKALGDGQITYGVRQCPGEETRALLLACLDDDARASRELLALLDSEDEVISGAALRAIGLSGKDVYLGKLLEVAVNVDHRRASLVASALRGFRSEKARRTWLQISLSKVSASGHVRTALTAADKWAAEPLLKVIEDGGAKPGHRNEAVNALAVIAGPKVENAGDISRRLARLHADRARDLRTSGMLLALARYGCPEGRDALLEAMDKAPNGYTLCGVLRAVSEWPGTDEKLSRKVREIAESKKPEWSVVRHGARRALAALGGKDSIEVLKSTALAMHAVRGGVRKPPPLRNYVYMTTHPGYAAVEMLREMNCSEAREALVEIAAETKDPLLRQQLRRDSLSSLPPEKAAAGLLCAAEETEKTDPKQQQLPLASLGRTMQGVFEEGGEEVAAALRKLAGGPLVDARRLAASGMAGFPGGAMKDDLLGLTRDPDQQVAFAAWSGLLKRHLRDEEGRRMIANVLKGGDEKRKEALLRALALGPKSPFDGWRDREELSELVRAGGKAAEFARGAMRAGGPRGVSASAVRLKCEDKTERWRARFNLFGYGFDPRVPVALEEHRRTHPDDFKRRNPAPRRDPGPREPVEVF
jgi:RNA polymerase sigma-70 factor (ECF subfamily)